MTAPAMASAEVSSDLAQREAASGSGGLLSKFSRTPSRKHKARPSSETAGLSEATQVAQGLATPKVRARPSNQRTTTAPPAAPMTLNSIKHDAAARQESSGTIHTMSGSTASSYGATLSTSQSAPPQPPSKSPSLPQTPDVPQVNAALAMQPAFGQSAPVPLASYQQIYDMSNKRIATLDYMRKAHEGRTFWFNTVQFGKGDMSKLPSYTPGRLSRRATNYLLLGMSIPAVLDVYPTPHPSNSAAVNASIAQDYLRNLNILLVEFETFQQLHPTDGSSASSLSRARLPQMFKRATNTSRPRKSSGTVAEIGLPIQNNPSTPAMPEGGHGHSHQQSVDTTYTSSSFASSATNLASPPTPSVPSPIAGFPTTSAFPPPAAYDAPNSSLLLNEGPYTHLLTPPLPFAPDFYTVFATLCDVLIDAYQKLLQLLNNPAVCTPGLGELFSKADARLRKVMVGGIVREFELASRENAKRELIGVQKVVLGGLMGS